MSSEVDALRREVAELRHLVMTVLEISNASAEAGLEHRVHTDEVVDRLGAAVVSLAEAVKRRTSDVSVLADQVGALIDAAEPDGDEPWRESLRPDDDES